MYWQGSDLAGLGVECRNLRPAVHRFTEPHRVHCIFSVSQLYSRLGGHFSSCSYMNISSRRAHMRTICCNINYCGRCISISALQEKAVLFGQGVVPPMSAHPGQRVVAFAARAPAPHRCPVLRLRLWLWVVSGDSSSLPRWGRRRRCTASKAEGRKNTSIFYAAPCAPQPRLRVCLAVSRSILLTAQRRCCINYEGSRQLHYEYCRPPG